MEQQPTASRTRADRPRSNNSHGTVALTLVFAIVGFLLASQLQSVRFNSQEDAATAGRLETLQELYNQELDKVEGLERQLTQVQEELAIYRRQASEGSLEGEALRAELEKLEITAGLVEVTGPGVSVILSDSAAVNTTGDEANYLIHDSDLLSVVNELRSAGAEAISLNGERLLATSEIRCTGAVVTVNGRRYAAPYVIFAIGDPATLYNALTMRNGVVDILGQWRIQVQVAASEALTIPKYQGAVEYRYAKGVETAPTQEGGGV
ncbi:DUF881 domain-containing protein [Vermiculatibacterium agrestimuris]|uniref:DUF881 domain-containing protein n=1 Tax=Vermiculatibacterium agrestimuris TaxID=2941519 RepID=UPI00203B5ECE|nr:DUF881 domain-containing protein [Vermiculatibacterium agrestimuris]